MLVDEVLTRTALEAASPAPALRGLQDQSTSSIWSGTEAVNLVNAGSPQTSGELSSVADVASAAPSARTVPAGDYGSWRLMSSSTSTDPSTVTATLQQQGPGRVVLPCNSPKQVLSNSPSVANSPTTPSTFSPTRNSCRSCDHISQPLGSASSSTASSHRPPRVPGLSISTSGSGGWSSPKLSMSPLPPQQGSNWQSIQLPPTPPVPLPMSPVARSPTASPMVVPEQPSGVRRTLPARSIVRVVPTSTHGSPKAPSRTSTPATGTPNAPWMPAGVTAGVAPSLTTMPRTGPLVHPRSGSPEACRVSSVPFGIQGAMVAPPNTLRVLRPSVSMPSISAVCLMPVLQGRRMATPGALGVASRAESPNPSSFELRCDTPMTAARHRGSTSVTQMIKGRRTPPRDGAGADFTMAPTPARARGGISGGVSPPPSPQLVSSPQLLSTPEVNTRSLQGDSGSDSMLGSPLVPGVGGAGRPPPPPMPPPPMPPPTQQMLQGSCGGGRLEGGHT